MRKKGNLTKAQMAEHADAWLAVHGSTPGTTSYKKKSEPRSQFPYVAHVLKVVPAKSKTGRSIPGTYSLLLADVDDFVVHIKAKSRRDAIVKWLESINHTDPEDLL